MTDEEIVGLYKTSTGVDLGGYHNTIEELKKFAEAVAKTAMLVERENCAKICLETKFEKITYVIESAFVEMVKHECAKQIRAGKNN